jgi:PadR family transcriptional regulator, regulatory protein PadR
MANLRLVKGTLDVLVLKALSWNTMHGFEISVWLETHSGGRLEVEGSALYHALYRLEERGYVEAHWGMTENNRRARYYVMTRTGSSHLKREAQRLTAYATTLTSVLVLEREAS